MKKNKSLSLGIILFSLLSTSAQAKLNAGDLLDAEMGSLKAPTTVDWSQPPIGCSEEMIPALPSRTCLDLSAVTDPLNDWPAAISPDDQEFWTSHRRYLSYCRGQEVMRREAATPGSQKASAVELAWLIAKATENYTANVAAVAEANEHYGIPQAVLAGAIYQESLFADLSVGEDGGNYSCGVGQFNLISWCNWANLQSATEKQALGWPRKQVDCNDASLVRLEYVKPLYDLAKLKLGTLPAYKMDKSYFAGIQLSDVIKEWPAASGSTERLRFQLVRSFTDHCSEARNGILVTAHELAGIFRDFISPAMQAKDHYKASEHFHRTCQSPDHGTAYPLHTGWLLAVASYNAGPRAVNAVAYYNEWTREEYNSSKVVKNFMPDDLISSLYGSGKYNPITDDLDFRSFDGGRESWTWSTACVVQRHIAKVMQNMTLLPEFFVTSLEGSYPCAKSVFDHGHLVQSAVPPARQASSGRKDQ